VPYTFVASSRHDYDPRASEVERSTVPTLQRWFGYDLASSAAAAAQLISCSRSRRSAWANNTAEIPHPRTIMMHDFRITKSHVIWLDQPVNLESLAGPARWTVPVE